MRPFEGPKLPAEIRLRVHFEVSLDRGLIGFESLKRLKSTVQGCSSGLTLGDRQLAAVLF